MAIARDLSTLPAATKPRVDGLPPDETARFGPQLVEAWAQTDRFTTALPVAKKGARFRHSDAGNCARAVAYAALGDLPTVPLDTAAIWVMNLGHIVHDAIQEVLTERYGDRIQVELKVGSGERAGHVDAVVTIPEGGAWVDVPADDATPSGEGGFADKVVCVEFKTVGGFAYKMAVGERGAPQGPKFAHRVQVALNAAEVDADEAVIVYLAKDAISVGVAARKKFSETLRYCAEWTFSRDEYMPLAEAERDRVAGILALLDDGTLPARKIPGGEVPAAAVVVDPSTGRWEVHGANGIEDTGTAWNCGYCRWQPVCEATPAGRCDLDVLEALR